MARLARELRCLFEFWLLPLVVALLPYRAGVALARGCARALPLYDAAARAGLAQYAAARPYGDTYAWLAEFRFTQLIDHADLFWTWTRSERFLLDRIDARPPTGLNPLVVVSMHYGQGLWLLRWLRAGGLPARFLSVRFDPSAFESRLHYLYARLRMRTVERMAGVPPIYTGGAKEEIALTLGRGGVVYGLIDVPVAPGTTTAANALLFGQPVYWPPGLVDCARAADADVMLLCARCLKDGRRHVDARGSPTPTSGASPRHSAARSKRRRVHGTSGICCPRSRCTAATRSAPTPRLPRQPLLPAPTSRLPQQPPLRAPTPGPR